MSVRFPYEKVSKGDRVLIYGAGELGQKLFWQIHSNRFCKLVGIVDSRFTDNVQPPLFSVDQIFDNMFDKVVIASLNPKFIKEICCVLQKKGVNEEKIIMEYPFDDFAFTSTSSAEKFQKHYKFCKGIMDICTMSDSEFAGHFVYQSFSKIGVDGKRDSTERLDAYQIKNYLNKSFTVLDVGCNCGFFDLQIAPFVKSVLGVDVDPKMVKMGEFVADYLKIKNVSFACQNIFMQELEEQYDVVCLFAVHAPVLECGNLSRKDFAEKIMKLLRRDGYLFFESHPYFSDSDDDDYRELDKIFRKDGLKLVFYRYHYGIHSGNMNRDISIYQKL